MVDIGVARCARRIRCPCQLGGKRRRPCARAWWCKVSDVCRRGIGTGIGRAWRTGQPQCLPWRRPFGDPLATKLARTHPRLRACWHRRRAARRPRAPVAGARNTSETHPLDNDQRQPGTMASSRCWPRVCRNMTAGRAPASPWASWWRSYAPPSAVSWAVSRAAVSAQCDLEELRSHHAHVRPPGDLTGPSVGHPCARRHCSQLDSRETRGSPAPCQASRR